MSFVPIVSRHKEAALKFHMPPSGAGWRFVPKHRWEFKNNPICGICLGAWIRLVWSVL